LAIRDARQIPRPAGKSAGLRDDAAGEGSGTKEGSQFPVVDLDLCQTLETENWQLFLKQL